MADASSGTGRRPPVAMIAGAMSASVVGAAVTYGDVKPPAPFEIRGGAMTPQDQQFVDAKIEARVAELRGNIKLNTAGLSDLRDRFDDLTKRMSDVPTNIATITERVAHLPTKEYLVRTALGSLAVIAALITFGEKLQHFVK